MNSKSKVFELVGVRVLYNRLLYYQKIDLETTSGVKVPNPIQIPFGSVHAPDNHKFFIKLGGTELYELCAVAEDNPKDEIQILPEYRWEGKINTKKYGDIDVEVRELKNDADRRRAMQLIMRAHYLNPPLRGLFLGCWLTNLEQIKKIRAEEKSRQKDHFSDSAWVEPINRNGHMVGCAVLDTLYQGLPNGRKAIVRYKKLTKVLDDSGNWIKKKDEKLRSKIVNLLSVAWGSRFVVDEPYQGLNLGTLLAEKLVDVAYLYKVPRAKFIEVITTETTQKAKERLKHPKTSFLGKAGYILNQDEMPSRRMLVPDKDGNRIKPESVRKLYYFIETSVYDKRKK